MKLKLKLLADGLRTMDFGENIFGHILDILNQSIVRQNFDLSLNHYRDLYKLQTFEQ